MGGPIERNGLAQKKIQIKYCFTDLLPLPFMKISLTCAAVLAAAIAPGATACADDDSGLAAAVAADPQTSAFASMLTACTGAALGDVTAFAIPNLGTKDLCTEALAPTSVAVVSANCKQTCGLCPAKCSSIANDADFCGDKVYDATKDDTDCAATACSKNTPADVTACCKAKPAAAKCASAAAVTDFCPAGKMFNSDKLMADCAGATCTKEADNALCCTDVMVGSCSPTAIAGYSACVQKIVLDTSKMCEYYDAVFKCYDKCMCGSAEYRDGATGYQVNIDAAATAKCGAVTCTNTTGFKLTPPPGSTSGSGSSDDSGELSAGQATEMGLAATMGVALVALAMVMPQ